MCFGLAYCCFGSINTFHMRDNMHDKIKEAVKKYGIILTDMHIERIHKAGYELTTDSFMKALCIGEYASKYILVADAARFVAKARNIKHAAAKMRVRALAPVFRGFSVKRIHGWHVGGKINGLYHVNVYSFDEVKKIAIADRLKPIRDKPEPEPKSRWPMTTRNINIMLGLEKTTAFCMTSNVIEKYCGKRFAVNRDVVLDDDDIEKIKTGWLSEFVRPNNVLTVREIAEKYDIVNSRANYPHGASQRKINSIKSIMSYHNMEGIYFRQRGHGKGITISYKQCDVDKLVIRGVLELAGECDVHGNDEKPMPAINQTSCFTKFWGIVDRQKAELIEQKAWK